MSHLERVGAHPALDFANTVSWRGRPHAIEYLTTFGALLDWARTEGLLGAREGAGLARAAADTPVQAAAALRRARTLRETMFGIGRALARGAPPRGDAVAAVHAARVSALAQARLVPRKEGGWTPAWPPGVLALDRPWWPVAIAFAALLESPPAHPVGICPDCSWLYLDLSRNLSRRWCSSGDCGNRARGRRFRRRHHAS